MKKIFALAVLVVALLAFAATGFAAGTTREQYSTDGEMYTVTVNDLHVRTHPNLDGYLICNLAKGSKVKSMGSLKDDDGDNWYYVIMKDGNIGWVFGKYLEAAK